MIKVGRVVAIHPESNAVDVLMLDSGTRYPAVQVASGACSDKAGLSDLPDPGLGSGDSRWDINRKPKHTITALVMQVGGPRGMPVVMGFLPPQVCQILFEEHNRRIFRHPSDVYTLIDANGDTELYHPSGTYFRIGVNATHDDLTGKDFDGKWAITENTGTAPGVKLVVANGGATKAMLSIDHSGNVSVTCAGTLSLNSTGNMSLTTGGNLTLSVSGTLNATATSYNWN